MAATKIPILTLSVLTSEAVSAQLAVGHNGALASAGGPMLGLAADGADDGEMLAVDVLGTSIAIAGAEVSIGDGLEVGANGRLVVVDNGALVARALSAGGAGAAIEVLLIPA